MTLETKRQITSRKRYYDGTNPCDYITVHQTGNTNKGADAQAHANLQSKGNVRVASWQWSVDDKIAIQSYEDYRKCWHAGDGLGAGNTRSIGIEICINSDGDYKKAVHNGARLVALKMREKGISISRVVQHNNWSPYGKNCPAQIRGNKSGIDWDEFLALCLKYYDDSSAKPKPKPEVKPDNDDIDEDGFWGTDTTTEIQEALGTFIDGEVWKQSKAWQDDNPGLTWGWKWNGKANDGGSPMVHAMWKEMAKSSKLKKLIGSDDGKIGPKFITGLQTAMGTHPDGELWEKSPAIKKVQSHLNKGTFKKALRG